MIELSELGDGADVRLDGAVSITAELVAERCHVVVSKKGREDQTSRGSLSQSHGPENEQRSGCAIRSSWIEFNVACTSQSSY